jgi:hypothetical protein
MPATLPDYAALVCPQHAEALEVCNCACTCTSRTVHHATSCALLFPEAPRVIIPKESP